MVLAWEERRAADQLGEDTPHGPQIDALVVELGAQHHLGGSVPASDHVLGQGALVLLVLVEVARLVDASSQAEVANF